MRLLANENFAGAAVKALRARGHDVVWIREDSPGINDSEVLSRAVREDRILLTFDKDFGELAFRAQRPISSGIVLFRIRKPSASYVASVVVQIIDSACLRRRALPAPRIARRYRQGLTHRSTRAAIAARIRIDTG